MAVVIVAGAGVAMLTGDVTTGDQLDYTDYQAKAKQLWGETYRPYELLTVPDFASLEEQSQYNAANYVGENADGEVDGGIVAQMNDYLRALIQAAQQQPDIPFEAIVAASMEAGSTDNFAATPDTAMVGQLQQVAQQVIEEAPTFSEGSTTEISAFVGSQASEMTVGDDTSNFFSDDGRQLLTINATYTEVLPNEGGVGAEEQRRFEPFIDGLLVVGSKDQLVFADASDTTSTS